MKSKQKTSRMINKPIIKRVYNEIGRSCPDCQGVEFYNYNNIYIVCNRCGLIVESREPTTKGAGYYKEIKKSVDDHKTNFYKKFEQIQ